MSQVIRLRESAVYSQLAHESAVVALTAAGPTGESALRPLLEESLDWETVVTLANRERAVGPVARDLGRLGTGTVPTPVLERLARMGLVTEFQLDSLHNRLGKLLALLARHDIEALLLKGAGLAYSAYSALDERPMGDIDLLVHPDVAERAWKLALDNGWMRRRDVAEERSYEDHQHLPPLEDADGMQIGLEIHIALFTQQAPFTLQTSQLWERARRIAEAALHGSVYRPVGLAVNYHTTAIHPYWAPTLVPQVIVGAHIFYRRPGSGTVEAFSQTPADDEPDIGSPQLHFAIARQFSRPMRARYAAMPQVEIPVVERPVLYRALGQRQSASSEASRALGARQTASSDAGNAQPRQAAMRSGPRVVIQGGVRVFRGS